MSWFDPPHRLYTQTQRAARATSITNAPTKRSNDDTQDAVIRLETLLDSPQRRDLAVVLTWFVDDHQTTRTVFNDLAELFNWPWAAHHATQYNLLFLCNKGLFLGSENFGESYRDAKAVNRFWAYRPANVADYLHIVQRFQITSEEVIQLDRAFTMDYRGITHTPTHLHA